MNNFVSKYNLLLKKNKHEGILYKFNYNFKNIKLNLLLAFAIFLLLFAILGKYIAPYDPLKINYAAKLMAPSKLHLFGTDELGRDVFSRILSGALTSFSLTFLMILIISIVGTTIGMISGFFGGWFDTVIMRITDVLLAFPDTVFAIAVVGTMGSGLANTVISLSLIWWTKYARMARGLVSSLRTKEYITQARFGGANTFKIIFKYILPNLIPQILIMATIDIGGMMLSLASLSFLGLSSQPPAPEWGYMLFEGKSYMQTAPWLIIFPGIAIFIVVIVFNLLGDSIRDVLSPKEQ